MTPFLLPSDLKEQAKRERHRQIEEERRERIFNAKKRLIGIDCEALNRQIEEKKNREQIEKEEDIKYLLKLRENSNVLSTFERRNELAKKKIEKDLNEYRSLHQKFENRREYDLNKPNRYETDNLAPDPDDPRLGLSSMQKFEGEEDLTGTRKKIQEEQQQTWLLQQVIEKQNEKRDHDIADSVYEETQKAQGARYLAMKDMEAKCKRQLEIANQEYNRALAVRKMREKLEQMVLDIEDSQTHKTNQITSDLLTENKTLSASGLGPGRKTTGMFKGMDEDKLKEVKEIQKLQIAEKNARKKEEEMEDKYYEAYQKQIKSLAKNLDSNRKKMADEADANYRTENKRLAEEHKAYQKYLNNVVYTNRPTNEFYDQFNKTTR